MANLYAAMTGLPALEGPEAQAADLARLPVLERLLSRAERRPAEPDWRRWALGVAGLVGAPGDLPLGRLVAAAHGLAVGPSDTWLVATPVSLRPGLTSVQLAATVAIPESAAAGLAAHFTAEWRGEPWSLHALGSELVLRHDGPLEVATTDPVRVLGSDIGAALPTGAAGARLTRLMTEIQMWLHARPDAGGLNALWLWGAGREALAGTPAWPRLASADPYLAAARACHPGAGAASDELRHLGVGDWLAGGAGLAALDAAFGEPLRRDLVDGRFAAVHLHQGGTVSVLRRSDRLKLWRRTRPWWELAG